MKRLILALFCIFGFGFIFTSNTFAAEDVSVTVSGNVSQYSSVFSNCTGDCLNDYQYLIVETSSSTGYTNLLLNIRYDGAAVRQLYISTNLFFPTYNVYKLPYNGSNNNLLEWGQNYALDSDIKLTLTESLPSNTPDCPEPPAPEPCPDPEENSQFMNVVLDAFWKYHKVFAGAVASLIAIFVVYRIIKGLLR